MGNSSCVVVTSIHAAENILRQYVERGYDLIIVGDQKSPTRYELPCTYLDLTEQARRFPAFAKSLPVNHYARKNIGYLYALEARYKIIAEVDDDITPLDNWGELPSGVVAQVTTPTWPNLLRMFTMPFGDDDKLQRDSRHVLPDCVWARGFPLDLIKNSSLPTFGESIAADKVWVWQGWTTGAPDLDAVGRLVFNPVVKYTRTEPIALGHGVRAPFNSQDTFWTRAEGMAFSYLPASVPFRYTDILRSWIAQRGISALGGAVGYTGCNTSSVRNMHNLWDDLRDEIAMYAEVYAVAETLDAIEWRGESEDLARAYEALVARKLVPCAELPLVRLWLDIYSSVSR